MAKTDPTPSQIAALKNLGISSLSSKKTCASLLTWILNGGPEMGKRIAMVIDAQRRFVGKRVRYPGDGELNPPKTGTVLQIFYPNMDMRAALVEGTNRRFKSPLAAMVRWDKSVTHAVGISSLEVLAEEQEDTPEKAENLS